MNFDDGTMYHSLSEHQFYVILNYGTDEVHIVKAEIELGDTVERLPEDAKLINIDTVIRSTIERTQHG